MCLQARTPKIAGGHQKPEGRPGADPPSQPSEETDTTIISISTTGLQNRENKYLLF